MDRSKSMTLLESEFAADVVLTKKGRTLLQRDEIKKKCSFSKNKLYTFLLFNDALAYAHTDKKTSKLVMHQLIEISKDTVSCKFTKSRSPPHKLVLETSSYKPLTLFFEDIEVATNWLHSLSTLGEEPEENLINSTQDVLKAIVGGSNPTVDVVEGKPEEEEEEEESAAGTLKNGETKKAPSTQEQQQNQQAGLATATTTATTTTSKEQEQKVQQEKQGESTPVKTEEKETKVQDDEEPQPGAVVLTVSDPHEEEAKEEEETRNTDTTQEVPVEKEQETQPESLPTASSMIQLADTAYDVPVWVPDEDSDQCMICQEEWTFFNRRHHCRACGLLVCGSCSPHRLVLKNLHPKDKQRVCNPCESNFKSHGED